MTILRLTIRPAKGHVVLYTRLHLPFSGSFVLVITRVQCLRKRDVNLHGKARVSLSGGTSFAKLYPATQYAYDAFEFSLDFRLLTTYNSFDTNSTTSKPKDSYHEQNERSYPESNRGRPDVLHHDVTSIRTGSDNRYTIEPLSDKLLLD